MERVRGSGFKGGGMLRLGSMVAMLVVVWMLIGRARDPGMWKWLEGKQEEARGSGFGVRGEESKVQGPKSKERIQNSEFRIQKSEVGGEEAGTRDKLLTDESAAEWWAAKEQFQAVSDGTTVMRREEMPAYWRLFRWAETQSLEEMKQRADGTAVLNQFVQQPEEQRGKLFQLDLNVRRVMSYPAPENSAGIETVYEVWGFTRESQAWLYVVLTAHLPPGMPLGPNVDERATFAGYFLKTQGYHAAGAGPKDKALVAPLLVGRLARVETGPPVGPRPRSQSKLLWVISNVSWMEWVVMLWVLAMAGGVLVWIVTRNRVLLRKTQTPRLQPHRSEELQGWLAEAERGEAKKGAREAGMRYSDN